MNTYIDITPFPTANTQQQRIIKKLEKELGPTIMSALNDPNVTDINVNPDGNVWIERLDISDITKIAVLTPQARESIIKTVATSLNEVANKNSSTIGGELPLLGARFEGVLPPVAKPGPGFSIRKKATRILTFKDYLNDKILDFAMITLLQDSIENYDNVLIAGGTGTGKTTFINAYVDQTSKQFPHDRLVICEDVDEIQSNAPNTFKMISNRNNPLGSCIKTMLRLSPKRIIIGEIREADQAREAFQAWNTGHKGGVFSLHANSALDAIQRLEDLCQIAFNNKCQRLISRTVDKIIFFKKAGNKRKIQEFYSLQAFSKGTYNLTDLINNQEVKFL
ncbi:MAG: Flp pilus assembly complex ATPase component TadA [Proteobacteria bacterium]|nr:Flp pilus assembly complex ATPase component TadA [Pseudomonadota bacterium]MBU1586285.1 Flp pilus assembly complex ATPase component TadA [Pseudomonadota bacterium]MBU2453181.1 Flp pilus assembly complex ATPase component TadA [Pseudomonadota bacterium]MBU2630788.1 Flp pilus assembly complex ATPase component TadA [Pseudomonadota bacterium]